VEASRRVVIKPFFFSLGLSREFHLGGDLLAIYKVEKKDLIFIRIGTHNQLFK